MQEKPGRERFLVCLRFCLESQTVSQEAWALSSGLYWKGQSSEAERRGLTSRFYNICQIQFLHLQSGGKTIWPQRCPGDYTEISCVKSITLAGNSDYQLLDLLFPCLMLTLISSVVLDESLNCFWTFAHLSNRTESGSL